MAIDIATMDTATKLDYAEAVGLVRLSKITVSSPVPYVNISLPTGYVIFQVIGQGVTFDVGDGLVYVFSPDGGTTFYNDDTENAESYWNAGTDKNGAAYLVKDSVGDFTPGGGTGTNNFVMDIFPGDVDVNAATIVRIVGPKGININVNDFGFVSGFLEETGRQDVIRYMPYGNGDANPPTGTTNIIAGTFILLGIA